ncbi:MAG: serine/threonine-protein kinase [Polyangiales bacterium]
MVYPGSGSEDQAPAELGGWRLVELLGRGGMGEVWRAEREGPGGIRRRAALKRILTRLRNDGELLQRFIAEARISSRLEHPNIVSVIDFGDKPEPYLVFEYVEGISAADLLQEASRSRVKIPAVVAAFVCAEVASGLDYAHRKRDENGRPLEIVHRDVSPHNVLLSVEGAVKVGDFGVARAVDNTLRTRAGIQVGKLVYMAPEQAAGSPIDGRADVFSLGVVLWELLTLQPLFPRDDAATTLKRLQSGDIPAPSTIEPRIPATLDQIVLTALATDRERRFASAAAFAQALRGFVHSLAPGFDSSELIKILHKIAPSVSWHVATPPPVDTARVQAPQAPRPAAMAMPAVAMPGMPAMAAPAAPQQPPQSSPQKAPQPSQQQAPYPPAAAQVAPPTSPSGPPSVPNPAPSASPLGQQKPSPQAIGPSPASTSMHGVAAPARPSSNNTLIIVAVVIGGLVVTGLLITALLYSRRSSAAAADSAETSAAQSGAPVVTPSTLLGQLPTIAPVIVPTNSLAMPVPSDATPSVALPVAAQLLPSEVDAGPSDPAPPPGSSSGRASAAVQRAFSQHESEFVSCISAPSGTRARVSLRVQWDGAARLVRFVESSSEQLALPLDAQQCLKNVAQRVLAPSSVSSTLTVRWSFWVETRSVVGFENGGR